MDKQRVVKRSSAVSQLNAGTIIIFAFCVYILINIFIFLHRPHLTIYEVQQLPMASNTKAEAVIIRNETPVKTGIAGYVNYYMRNGQRVAKGETIYSIDESRQIYNLISEQDLKYTFSKDDISQIKECIFDYQESYDSSDFESVYSLRDDLTATVNNISDTYLLENLNQILVNKEYSGSLTVHQSEQPGLISYFTDTLDGLTVEGVTKATFDRKNYRSANLFDANLKEQGSTIYKILADEKWDIVLNLTEEQYNKISSQTMLSFTIEEDNLKLTKPVVFMHVGDSYLARITLNQYMVRYINKRFLTIALDIDNKTGLKIPKSAIVQKQFYMVPNEYFVRGGDNPGSEWGINVLKIDEKTKERYYSFCPTEIYYEDENYKYIDINTVTYNTAIYNDDTQETFPMTLEGTLTGVYNINKGFALFRRIEMLQDGKDFCVVEAGVPYSISEHDHIAKDSSTITESQTIY